MLRKAFGIHGLGIFATVCVLGTARASLGQSHDHGEGQADRTYEGRVSPLLDGMGSHSYPVSTTSPMAQRFFDQGLVLAYGFNHAEAARSFREAARIDPSCAMAYWGQALVVGPNINAPMDPENVPVAWEAVQKAIELKDKATPSEQALIEALATRYSQDPSADRESLDKAYAASMRRVQTLYPEDTDIATLTAEAIMDTMPWDYYRRDGRPRDATKVLLNLLEQVMAADPVNPGAHHLYIHVVESSNDPWRGESSARALEHLVPGAGHLVHMPGHIYLRVGRYHDAAEANVRATASDEGYFTACRMQGIYPAAYYPHNVHFLWVARMWGWEREGAVEAARKTASVIHEGMEDQMQQILLTPLACYARFAMWEDVLGEEQPDPERVYLTGFWHYARGLAYSGLGQESQARQELAALREVMERDDLETEQIFMSTTPKHILTIAEAMLEGEIELEYGDVERSIMLFDRATRLYDEIPYNEPEDWYYPPRHALGDALLKAGRPHEAETVYWRDLQRHPDNAWALTGLSKAITAEDDVDPEYREQVWQMLKNARRHADVVIESSRY